MDCVPGPAVVLLFFPVKNSVLDRRNPRATVPGIGCRADRPSPKKLVPRNAFIFGWSCMSRLQPVAIINTGSKRRTRRRGDREKGRKRRVVALFPTLPFTPSVFSDFDIINFHRAQTLQQLHHLRVIELRIVRFNSQEESIARR
jgi:hypothetical protein